MFDWLEDLLEAIGEMLGESWQGIGAEIANVIWDTMIGWIYETVFDAIGGFFESINEMGVEIFELEWVQAAVHLFVLFGWSLFVVGSVVAIFDVAIEYQHGRANIRSCALNILKGFFACSLIGILPIELYKFCISLHTTFAHDLVEAYIGAQRSSFASLATDVYAGVFERVIGVK